jgi:hypothetical protein
VTSKQKKCEPEQQWESENQEVEREDIIIKVPPVRRYTINARIRKITKGHAKIVLDDDSTGSEESS